MTWRNAIASFLLIPVVLVAGYIFFLWASYTSETTSSGSAYGFSIDSSKAESAAALENFRQTHPKAVVHVRSGHRAGDHFSVSASQDQLHLLKPHDQWDILLNGAGEFSNSVRLTFKGDRLVAIYRHRQYFELP
ncbi:hypothetical protein [Pseudoxanthomonas sp. PXM01]|uniref:hypothetical protein n=1 Tax=Pseudoxanthomonas sp. PXM01 TaxID=2769295 RepID=UPI00178196E6|nr:hypothetical protein [Pseudoxanthomonas sp. PXM01]MBD9468765.1 hypothetical protein [Pseudoxanthomonas sp. PXM01]